MVVALSTVSERMAILTSSLLVLTLLVSLKAYCVVKTMTNTIEKNQLKPHRIPIPLRGKQSGAV
jgi:hypothetical protein